MKVLGTLPRLIPGYNERGSLDLKISDNANVEDVIDDLKLMTDVHYSIIVNGNLKKSEDFLQAGDVVSIFIPVVGG